MNYLNKDGVTLAYEDTNDDLPPLLVHGCGCDHRSLAAQAEFFRNSRRVVSVDLRGHGGSDAPQQDYTMITFANDIVWLCDKLSLEKPAMVGHSMGGNVILELAARFPEVPSSLVMIDSVMLPPQMMLDTLQSQFAEEFARAGLPCCLPKGALSNVPFDGPAIITIDLFATSPSTRSGFSPF
jgi:pimeloyl-ACP methyl ester carboxylesterase